MKKYIYNKKTIKYAKIKLVLIIILLFCINLKLNLNPTPILLRGIVEGFYGTPYNFEIRVDLLGFCAEYNLNAYIYAPKDDPYHRDKWREPYPEDKLNELKHLAEISIKNNIHFIFAISPGADLNYEGEKGEQDFQSMLNKLDMMYNIRIRNFAIFFDDLIGEQSGENQANFLNRLQKVLNQKYKDIYPLITVPTDYYRQKMLDEEGNIKSYTKEFSSLLNKNIIVLYTGDGIVSDGKEFSSLLNKNIIVLYTGDGIVSDGITEKSFQAAKEIYGRNLGIWWNYPVNDYYLVKGNRSVKLALGPIEK